MSMLVLGESYPYWNELSEGITQDFAQYNYLAGIHSLLLGMERPSAREIAAVRRRPAHFALVVAQPTIHLLYRFGNLPWSDAPFSIHLVPRQHQLVPDLETNAAARAPLHTILVDRNTGRIKALRTTALSPAFTRSLHAAIREQAGIPFSRADYARAVSQAYRRWPTPVDMVRGAVAHMISGN